MLCVNFFWCVVWAKICPQLHVTVHALHSWILCNCEGPLLNPVPGNLIFTAAPDRNHLAVLISLYLNWKIAAALYVVSNSMSNFEFSAVNVTKTFLSNSENLNSLCKPQLFLENVSLFPKWQINYSFNVDRCAQAVDHSLVMSLLHCFAFNNLMNRGEVEDLTTQTQAFSPNPKNLYFLSWICVLWQVLEM